MSTDAPARPTDLHSRPLPFPKTERQAEFMELAERLAVIAHQHAAQHDREGSFPFETYDVIRASGYLALTVPEALGGRGANPLELSLAQERLSRADGSVGLSSWMHLGTIARQSVTRTWPDEVFQRVCRDIVERGALINSAASEPAMGSPSRGGLPATTATRVEGGWLLNGRKSWASLAPALDYIIVMTTVEDPGEPPRRANFLVTAPTPGLRIEPTWDTVGMRATGSHDIVLEDVFASDGARLPTEEAAGSGDPRIWTVVSGAVYLGIGVAARDFAVDFARGADRAACKVIRLPSTRRCSTTWLRWICCCCKHAPSSTERPRRGTSGQNCARSWRGRSTRPSTSPPTTRSGSRIWRCGWLDRPGWPGHCRWSATSGMHGLAWATRRWTTSR